MTLSEFRAWFEGFTENMDGPPNAKQWKRIQKRVGEIMECPQPLVIERYVDRNLRPYWDPPFWVSNRCNTDVQLLGVCGDVSLAGDTDVQEFFASVGRADALQIEG